MYCLVSSIEKKEQEESPAVLPPHGGFSKQCVCVCKGHDLLQPEENSSMNGCGHFKHLHITWFVGDTSGPEN